MGIGDCVRKSRNCRSEISGHRPGRASFAQEKFLRHYQPSRPIRRNHVLRSQQCLPPAENRISRIIVSTSPFPDPIFDMFVPTTTTIITTHISLAFYNIEPKGLSCLSRASLYRWCVLLLFHRRHLREIGLHREGDLIHTICTPPNFPPHIRMNTLATQLTQTLCGYDLSTPA